MKKLVCKVLFLTVLILTGCGQTNSGEATNLNSNDNNTIKTYTAEEVAARNGKYTAYPSMVIDKTKKYTAVINTNMGIVKVQLLADKAPLTVNNFVFLAKDKYFDGIVFHRVIKDFMIQCGDPSGNGTGGPGYKFNDELPPAFPYEAGIVAMANAGPNTNGSQFFICNGESSKNLNAYPNYTVFGKVVEGMDVVLKISSVPVGNNGYGEVSKPTEKVFVHKVDIIEE